MRRSGWLASWILIVAVVGMPVSGLERPPYEVRVVHDLVYGVGATEDGAAAIDLLLDLYLPVDAPGPLPVLLTIHGGGFSSGSKSHAPHVDHGEYFAARGVAVASIDYRLERHRPPADPEMIALGTDYDPSRPSSNHAAVHAAIVDTKTAIRWVHAQAGRYGFDPHRVYAIGSSAGGFCAVIAAITPADALDTDLPNRAIDPVNHPGEDADLQAVINLWGGAGPWLEELDAGDPPMMHVYGTEDWLYPEGLALRDRCTEVGAVCEWVPLDGYGHGAWNARIHGMPREAAILDFLQRHGL